MFKNMTVKARLLLILGSLTAMLVLIGIIGIREMSASNEGLRSVYQDRTIPVGQLSQIDSLMLKNQGLLLDSLAALLAESGDKKAVVKPSQATISANADQLKGNAETINKIWDAYMATYQTPEEKKLAEEFISKRTAYKDQALLPSLAALKSGNAAEANRLINDKVKPLYHEANTSLEALKQLQLDVAKSEYEKAASSYSSVHALFLFLIPVSALAAIVLGFFMVRAIVNPLKAMLGYFENIGRGKFDNHITVERQDETGQALEALKGLQQKLADSSVQAIDYQGKIDAISKSTGTIEFNMDGTVITANPNFLSVLGYTLEEAKGKHHRTFVDPAYASSPEYRAFWEKLNRGEFDAGEYKRIAKGGKEVWIQASYNPILDADGKPYKVVKFATEITEVKLRNADFQGQLEAIDKSMGAIAFNMDGTVISANQNFLAVINYTLDEVKGKHHSTFVDATYAASPEYRAFWEKLNRGEYDAGEYKRIAKGGKEVWIQASYNPIRDLNGKPYKVVKFASDITASKLRNADYQGQLEAIGKSMGVIEFNLDGTVVTANPNFLSVINYTLDEVKGIHHRNFVDPAYAASAEYREFWEKLNRGEFDAGEYKRIAKGGKEVWIQASYNPIRDLNGKPYKVVKYASDITPQKRYQMAVEAVLKETKAVMAALAEGDLTLNMEGEYEGEFAILRDAVVQSIDNLREIVQQIMQATDLISTASKEIAAGNTDLSSRTEEQASSLEETASSMEELASTVKQNAENAKQANQMATAASGVAVKGGEVVSQVVTTMAAINEASRKIVDIISVIDGIAFQTNILALNAAVEAARAGEQGRGFAVVAGEVRSLAQRSAAAAKEIKQLISDSVEKVEGGTKLVEQAGQTMDEIVTSVKRVTDIMAEITAASMEQSSGIDQVNQAITQMDEVTQQNAALVEEAAAAAESLEEQAQTLFTSVSVFKLADSAVAAKPNLRTVPAPQAIAAAKPARGKASSKKTLPPPAAEGEWEEF